MAAQEKARNEAGGEPEFAALIGVDWADEKLDICLMPCGEKGQPGPREKTVVLHRPEALAEWVAGLRQRFGGRKVALALEQSKGPLIWALMHHEFLVLYPIHPKSLARFREAFAPSQAKDDPIDAELALELLAKHRDRLRPWKPDDVQTRTLALLSEARRHAVDLRTELSNQLTTCLKGYFPQALDWVGETVYSPMACDFLRQWPTLQDLQRTPVQKIRKFYCACGSRRRDLVEARLQAIPKAVALTQDKAILECSVLTVRMLARQLRDLADAIQQYDQRLAEVFKDHPDAPIFTGLPGAADALRPRLLAAFGSDRDRYQSAEDVQTYSGIAPVTERSGKSVWVHWRWACPKFLRQTFQEFAYHSMKSCAWARAYYDQMIAKGKDHHAAVRALAFKWIRILFRCWKDRQPYDESRYLAALQKRGSPLHALMANGVET
jgi:transposase